MSMHAQALDFLHQLMADDEAEALDHDGPWIVISCDATVAGGTSALGPFEALVDAMAYASTHEAELNASNDPEDVPFVCYPLPLRSPS